MIIDVRCLAYAAAGVGSTFGVSSTLGASTGATGSVHMLACVQIFLRRRRNRCRGSSEQPMLPSLMLEELSSLGFRSCATPISHLRVTLRPTLSSLDRLSGSWSIYQISAHHPPLFMSSNAPSTFAGSTTVDPAAVVSAAIGHQREISRCHRTTTYEQQQELAQLGRSPSEQRRLWLSLWASRPPLSSRRASRTSST